MSNATILTPNHTLDATSVTVSPTPPVGYEATNLQDPDRTKKTKVTGASATITMQMTGNPWVHALALSGLGYSVNATFRLMGNSTNSWSSPDYDSGELGAYPAGLAMGEGLFGDYGMGGFVTPADFPYFRPTKIFYLDELKTYSWWRIVITDTGASEISIGLVALLRAIEMPQNFAYGARFGVDDTTTTRESTSGAMKAGRPGTRLVTADLDFKLLPDSQKNAILQELMKVGTGTPFFLDTARGTGGPDEVFGLLYGQLERAPDHAIPHLNMWNTKISFRETR